MKPAARTTVVAIAAFVCVIAWLVAALGIAGVWLDCIPNDPKYGCLSPTAAWQRTVGLAATASIVTLVTWLGVRRLTGHR